MWGPILGRNLHCLSSCKNTKFDFSPGSMSSSQTEGERVTQNVHIDKIPTCSNHEVTFHKTMAAAHSFVTLITILANSINFQTLPARILSLDKTNNAKQFMH